MTPVAHRPFGHSVSGWGYAAPAWGRGTPAHLAYVRKMIAFALFLSVNATDHLAFVTKAG